MGSLITYSGIAAKVKAMERWRIKDEQFEEMASLGSVLEALEYLRRFLPYREIFEDAGEEDLHRGSIEQRLNLSQYRDFAKLYQFANMKQRRFLDLYFMHYEITIIKTCLRNAVGHRAQRQDLSMFQDFFDRHSSIDLILLSQSGSAAEFVGNLKGSPYYEPLNLMLQNGKTGLPVFETALDMLYFRTMWKIKDRYLSKDEQKIMVQCFGTRMDMLNLEWLCRSKKFYQLSTGEIYAMLIPIQLHLTKSEINRMAEAGTLEQLYGLIRSSWYGRLDVIRQSEQPDLDHLTYEITDRIYQMTRRKDPYSIAILNSYLYFKEREIARIINTIERIRYGVAANTLKGVKT